MREIVFFICLLSIIPINTKSQENLSEQNSSTEFRLKTPDKVIQSCNAFFKTLIEGKTEEAFNQILKDSPIKDKKDKVKELIEQTRLANSTYGLAMSYEQVSSEAATESLIKLQYITLHEKYPMRWIFTFYKSPKLGWIVVSLRFDDMSEFLFTE